jgi:hypothetical protein
MNEVEALFAPAKVDESKDQSRSISELGEYAT